MGKTSYYSAGGELYGESTAGVATTYMSDALGSTIGTVTSAGVRNRYTYSPYGVVTSKTGTDPDPRFLWNGRSGYRETARAHASHYVRARIFDDEAAQWTTLDRFWPEEAPYAYAGQRPATLVDPSGLFNENFCFGFCVGFLPIYIECVDDCLAAHDLDVLNRILHGVMARRGNCGHPTTFSDCFNCAGAGGVFEDQCAQCMVQLDNLPPGFDWACWCDWIAGNKPPPGAKWPPTMPDCGGLPAPSGPPAPPHRGPKPRPLPPHVPRKHHKPQGHSRPTRTVPTPPCQLPGGYPVRGGSNPVWS
ncbi:MAG: RHS repeat domain-containing protein [Fimbriimonadaceae bacterium]